MCGQATTTVHMSVILSFPSFSLPHLISAMILVASCIDVDSGETQVVYGDRNLMHVTDGDKDKSNDRHSDLMHVSDGDGENTRGWVHATSHVRASNPMNASDGASENTH